MYHLPGQWPTPGRPDWLSRMVSRRAIVAGMTVPVALRHVSALGWVLAGGLTAGALDIAYACIFWAVKAGVRPVRIFQSVAEGLLGAAAFRGGAATAVLGLALHMSIATTMATAYYVAALRWPELARHPWRFGPLYGLALYAVMNHVVLPLSAAGAGSADPAWIGGSIVVHALFIGLPIALAVRRAQ